MGTLRWHSRRICAPSRRPVGFTLLELLVVVVI
ncbi:MAG: prepilin-type N-terminal cleavage/methylation domain-containing protein, partial [Vicinamibacterales bacterium]